MLVALEGSIWRRCDLAHSVASDRWVERTLVLDLAKIVVREAAVFQETRVLRVHVAMGWRSGDTGG